MGNDQVWFRRWLGFGFVPVAWQGWLAIAALLLVELPILGLSDHFDRSSLYWWLLGMVGFAIFIGFYALVLAHLRTTDRR